MSEIQAPPEFMPHKPDYLKCEGYWSEDYMPIVSKQEWPDKQKFCEAVTMIEKYLTRKRKVIHYRGLSPSRLYPNQYVGSKEYKDKHHSMGWPEDYVQHYILENNVMPTERFFNYVCERVKTIN